MKWNFAHKAKFLAGLGIGFIISALVLDPKMAVESGRYAAWAGLGLVIIFLAWGLSLYVTRKEASMSKKENLKNLLGK